MACGPQVVPNSVAVMSAATGCLEGTVRVSSMVAELASLDWLVWISVTKSQFHWCQPWVSVRAVDLGHPANVRAGGAQDPEGLMQRSLPALGTTRCAAHDLKVAAACCARRPGQQPPVDRPRGQAPVRRLTPAVRPAPGYAGPLAGLETRFQASSRWHHQRPRLATHPRLLWPDARWMCRTRHSSWLSTAGREQPS